MKKETVLETRGATLWYYPEERIVHHQIHRHLYGEELRALFLKGLEQLRENGARKWVSDHRKNGAISRDDAEWISGTWEPAALDAGWRCWALLQPESIPGRMNIRRFLARGRAIGLVVEVFDSPEVALAWIAKQGC